MVVLTPFIVPIACAVVFPNYLHWQVYFTLWIIASLAVDLFVTVKARVDLLRRLRERVAEGFWRTPAAPPAR